MGQELLFVEVLFVELLEKGEFLQNESKCRLLNGESHEDLIGRIEDLDLLSLD